MSTHNQISVIGNIGGAPELRATTQSGAKVVSFSIAQNRIGAQGAAQWFQVTCFGSLAKRVLAHTKKGDLLLIVGELRAQTYKDKSGENRLSFEIAAKDIYEVKHLPSMLDSEMSPQEGVSDSGDVPSKDVVEALE